jgi:dTDP-glucose pyrophosphorylase
VSAQKAVVLAAGRGSRMRASHAGDPQLDQRQAHWADLGLKTLIPFHGHPFLAHVMSALADGGIQELCVVVGPGDDPVREYLKQGRASRSFRRLQVDVAVQEHPTGSAHALVAARSFAGDDDVLVVNGDNLYPAAVVDEVRRLQGDGLAGFRARALVERSAIEAPRIASFALISVDERGCLNRIIEKPDEGEAAGFGPDPMVSMTCWRFTPATLDACRRVQPSARGEYELPDAVRLRVRDDGACVRVVPVEAGVLDLTRRADIPRVETLLEGREVRL